MLPFPLPSLSPPPPPLVSPHALPCPPFPLPPRQPGLAAALPRAAWLPPTRGLLLPTSIPSAPQPYTNAHLPPPQTPPHPARLATCSHPPRPPHQVTQLVDAVGCSSILPPQRSPAGRQLYSFWQRHRWLLYVLYGLCACYLLLVLLALPLWLYLHVLPNTQCTAIAAAYNG